MKLLGHTSTPPSHQFCFQSQSPDCDCDTRNAIEDKEVEISKFEWTNDHQKKEAIRLFETALKDLPTDQQDDMNKKVCESLCADPDGKMDLSTFKTLLDNSLTQITTPASQQGSIPTSEKSTKHQIPVFARH